MAQDRKQHRHRDIIVAWADGAEIERLGQDGDWMMTEPPTWNSATEYRIKPAPRTFWATVYGPDAGSLHASEAIANKYLGNGGEVIKVVEVL